MTPEQWQETIDRTFNAVQAITSTKGVEYRKGKDQLDNFYRQAREVGITPLQVWRVFFQKHADAITSFIRSPARATSEPIEGRIDDAIVYLLLLKGLIAELPLQGVTHVEIKADAAEFLRTVDHVEGMLREELHRFSPDDQRASAPADGREAKEGTTENAGAASRRSLAYEHIATMGDKSVTHRVWIDDGHDGSEA